MTTLTDFLLARIAEDEAVAQAGIDGDIDRLPFVENNGVRIHIGGGPHALAECEAKRRIVEQHVEHASRVASYRSPRWVDGMNDNDILNRRKAEAVCAATDSVVRALALPYADHPDYQAEWASA